MLEKQLEERTFELELVIVHAAEHGVSPDIEGNLTIHTEELTELPRLLPDTLQVSFDSDWLPEEGNQDDLFSEWYPNGLTLEPNFRQIYTAPDDHVYDLKLKDLRVARYYLTVTAESEYMWDDDEDFEEQGFYENVQLATLHLLRFSFGELDVLDASVRHMEIF